MHEQEIRDWSVAGDDRIVGLVHHRPGQSNGQAIITSPVVRVRFLPEDPAPMAITESGSWYWLGTPAARFGMDKAQAFLARLASSTRPPNAPRRDAGASTTELPRLPSAPAPLPIARPPPSPTLAVTCDSCRTLAVATLAEEIHSVNAAGGIRIDDPCPECGGKLAAQPGKYVLDERTGSLERIGEFEPHSPPGPRRREAVA